MKDNSLVSFILLSILIIILLSTAVQATEYREVKAEELLKQIENGEDVNLTSCRIVGELNISNVKLKTVPNPYFYKLLKEGHDKEIIIYDGFPENLSIIESNMTIRDSIFENNVNFSSLLFKNPAYFFNTHFNGSVNFTYTNFNSRVDFSDTNFNNFAYFVKTNFNDSAYFNNNDFNDSAYFSMTNFNGFASFIETKFNHFANFIETNFSSDADFTWTTFNDNVDFTYTNFNGFAYFIETKFNDSSYFTDINFNGDTHFCGANYNSNSIFTDANFNDGADFSDINFNGDANFSWTNFNGKAYFTRTKFYGPAYFIETKFNDSADFGIPDTSENIITQGGSSDIFRKHYITEARYADADNIYYNNRKYAQDSKDILSLSKWTDIIIWATCGYGLRPLRIFWPGVFIVGFFALFYWLGSGIYNKPSDENEKKSNLSVWDALYFSVNTFTTLGSTDWYPRENFRKWVTLEGLLGWIMLGIFMATLTNVMIRS